MKKGMQIFTSWCLCLTLYLSCFATYASEIAVYRYVNVTPVEQAEDDWCWAACAEMCGKTVNRQSTRTQHNIVAYLTGVKGTKPTGSGYDTIDGCKYASINKKDFTADLFEFFILTNWTSKNEAVVALCFDKRSDKLPGHALLVNGTHFYDGDGESWLRVYYIDPAYGKEFDCLSTEFADGSGNGGWLPKLAVHSV